MKLPLGIGMNANENCHVIPSSPVKMKCDEMRWYSIYSNFVLLNKNISYLVGLKISIYCII